MAVHVAVQPVEQRRRAVAYAGVRAARRVKGHGVELRHRLTAQLRERIGRPDVGQRVAGQHQCVARVVVEEATNEPFCVMPPKNCTARNVSPRPARGRGSGLTL
jgi:hypothetical protein